MGVVDTFFIQWRNECTLIIRFYKSYVFETSPGLIMTISISSLFHFCTLRLCPREFLECRKFEVTFHLAAARCSEVICTAYVSFVAPVKCNLAIAVSHVFSRARVLQ